MLSFHQKWQFLLKTKTKFETDENGNLGNRSSSTKADRSWKSSLPNLKYQFFFQKSIFFQKQSITISRNAILASNFDATYVDYDTSTTIIYKTFEKNHFLFEHRFDKSQAKRKRNVKSSSALCVLKLFPNQNRSALFFEMKFFDSEEKEKNEFRVFRICILSRTQD